MIITSEQLKKWLTGIRESTAGTDELLDLRDVLEQLDSVIGQRKPEVPPAKKPREGATHEEVIEFLDSEHERLEDESFAAWNEVSMEKAKLPGDRTIDSAIQIWIDTQLRMTNKASTHEVDKVLNELSQTLTQKSRIGK